MIHIKIELEGSLRKRKVNSRKQKVGVKVNLTVSYSILKKFMERRKDPR
jgi:hypothetical protein